MRATLTGEKRPSDAPLIIFVAVWYLTILVAVLAAIGGAGYGAYLALHHFGVL